MQSEKIHSLQALRFFAASVVVAEHIEDRLMGFADRFQGSFDPLGFSGRFGVDIFFVISGFIMANVSRESFGQPLATLKFAIDRVSRITPLYWLCTLAMALLAYTAAVLGDPGRANAPTVPELVKSLLHIPYADERGLHRPILGQGWTLDLEMMFYFLFAACLTLDALRGYCLLASLFLFQFAASVTLELGMPFSAWANPIIFEFLIGILIAELRFKLKYRHRVRQVWLLQIAAIAAITLAFGKDAGGLVRVGAASALTAICAFSSNNRKGKVESIFETLGDWSYSLYLTHGFVLLLVGIAWRKLFHGSHMFGYVTTVVLLSAALAYVANLTIEKRMSGQLRSWAYRHFLGNHRHAA